MSTEIQTYNKISPVVRFQLPEFVREDHPTFIAFIKAYYEWMEESDPLIQSPQDLLYLDDLDRTFDAFVDEFKRQYLHCFPEQLAVRDGVPVDSRKLMKNIKQFYRAKGTEKSFELLFRILYDASVEFYYPKEDILRCSDGKWIVRKSIRTTTFQGSKLFQAIGKTVKQKNSSGSIVASGRVASVSQYQLGSYEINEMFLEGINGTFLSDLSIEFPDNNGDIVKELKVYPVIASISVGAAGSNYKIGDKVAFSGSQGIGADAEVESISSSGGVNTIKMINFGANYRSLPDVTITSETGTGFTGSAVTGGFCEYPGFYDNNDGKVSSNKRLQDNRYFQEYSYVLKAEVTIDRYRNAVRKLCHPAGMAFFGTVLIARCSEEDPNRYTSVANFYEPVIGHYLPYTNETYDDLPQWFTVGSASGPSAQGYGPTAHDPLLTGPNGSPNPVTDSIEFKISPDPLGDPDYDGPSADPWWIIYTHPNRLLDGEYAARIWEDDKDIVYPTADATGWHEWMETQAFKDRWYAEWDSGPTYQNIMLDFGNTSAFYKITIGDFLNMSVGYEFECGATF